MELSSANVEAILRNCLIGSEAPDDNDPDLKKVEGILTTFAFSRQCLTSSKDDIVSMLSQLNSNFLMKSGGGWTFLNLCEDAKGNLWTGLHQVCEHLCCLAIGVGVGHWLMPRDMWPMLPGGLPYVGFDVAPLTEDA